MAAIKRIDRDNKMKVKEPKRGPSRIRETLLEIQFDSTRQKPVLDHFKQGKRKVAMYEHYSAL